MKHETNEKKQNAKRDKNGKYLQNAQFERIHRIKTAVSTPKQNQKGISIQKSSSENGGKSTINEQNAVTLQAKTSMALINEHYLKLTKDYFYADVAKRLNAYMVSHPGQRVVNLGTGDVTQPLCPAVVEAMHRAVDEMSTREGFRGYGPEQGYLWLREAIVKNDFLPRGIHLSTDEIFINDGAKGDTGSVSDLVRWDNSMAVTDPIYPVYIDANVMNGRSGTVNERGEWSNVTYIHCEERNGFIPALPEKRVDMIYLCNPNNPMGIALNKNELRRWVSYALKNDAIIFFDAAYHAYIHDDDIPHSIYEIKGARKCAIELRSFSKTAGFTGIRCGYTVVPKELTASTLDGTRRLPLNPLWLRRQLTKSNGTSYISQRAAEATFTPEGKEQIRATIDYYMDTPYDMPSWRFFNEMLYGAQVVCAPGIGFGPAGEGFVRLTSFGQREDCEEALLRIRKWMNK